MCAICSQNKARLLGRIFGDVQFERADAALMPVLVSEDIEFGAAGPECFFAFFACFNYDGLVIMTGRWTGGGLTILRYKVGTLGWIC